MAKTVLTVDTSKTMREMVGFALRQAGYEVVEAEDGMKAMALLAGNAPDCIITDLALPQMDGLSFIKNVRAQDSWKDLPILTLARDSNDIKNRAARHAGANGAVMKPFNPQHLVDTVRKVCPNVRAN